jgi:broad specificity phosphatase PhoE
MRRAIGGAALAFILTTPAGAGTTLEKLPPPAPGAVRVYLVRHGESLENLRKPPRATDLDHLTPRGHVQAQAAGRALAGEGVEAIVTSPAARARETTADIQPLLHGVPVRTDDRIGPLRAGQAPDGHHLTWDERIVDWKHGRDPRPPGGESLTDLGARITGAVRDLGAASRAGHGPHAVVLVTHTETVEGLIGAIKKRLPLHATMTGVHNGSITVVDVEPDGRLDLRVVDQRP